MLTPPPPITCDVCGVPVDATNIGQMAETILCATCVNAAEQRRRELEQKRLVTDAPGEPVA